MRQHWIALRNHLLTAPWTQRWAPRLPLLRNVVRRHAQTLFDYTAGFAYSQVLLACVQLDLTGHLGSRPQDAAALGTRMGLAPGAALRLLRAAAALDIAEALPGPGLAEPRFVLGRYGALLQAKPGLRAMIAHHAMAYADLADPVALLQGRAGPGALARFWGYAGHAAPASLPAAQIAAYSRLMAESQALVAGLVLDAYDLRQHGCLLDIGGGEGAFSIAAAARAPQLRFLLFDLPAVVARAQAALQAAGLQARSHVHGGNFLCDALPRGADAASLVRVLHDHDDAAAATLLRAAHAALAASGGARGGTLIIAEPMSGPGGAGRAADAYFGLYLAAMGSGRARRPDEIFALLRQAGFHDPHWHATAAPALVQLITARA